MVVQMVVEWLVSKVFVGLGCIELKFAPLRNRRLTALCELPQFLLDVTGTWANWYKSGLWHADHSDISVSVTDVTDISWLEFNRKLKFEI